MKQNVKIFFIALIIGMVISYLICDKTTIIGNALSSKATYFYVGTYNNLEDANNKCLEYENAIIYEDNNLYIVIIGVYTSNDAILLMESYFLDQGITFEKNELEINSEYISISSTYESIIINGNKSYYEEINTTLLNLFNEYK